MSYLVLARKSRPQSFSEVVGQEPIVRTLQNSLSQGRVPHALIFSGVRGTGKTTLARIMAKALNCENGPTSEPCNQCRSCREVTDGGGVDLQEVDGASNRGIQEIRELKEKIRFMPTSARFKIIIIDEVHMLTVEAFNALLKTLEEPPEHVYFMFATTELHKVPLTILSRCQRYELKRIGHNALSAHFKKLAEQESVIIQQDALDLVVREAGGSVRDGLSLLDQVFSYCGKEVSVDEVVEVLGLVNHRVVSGLASALLTGELAEVYQLLDEVYAHGLDFKRLNNDLLSWFRGLIVCKVSKQPAALLDLPETDIAVLEKMAAGYSIGSLSSVFNLLLEGFEKASFSPQPRLAMELSYIQAVQVKDVVPVSDLISRFDEVLAGSGIEELQRRPEVVSIDTPPVPRREAESPIRAPEIERVEEVVPESPLASKSKSEISVEQERKLPEPEGVPKSSVKSPANNRKEEATVEERPAGKVKNRKAVRHDWDEFIRYVHDRQPWMSTTLQRAASFRHEAENLILRFEDSAECSLLKSTKHCNLLTEFALDFFQENLTIRFEVPDEDRCEVNPDNGMTPQQERQALGSDPLVLTALDVFTGQVGDIRIGPRFRKKMNSTAEQPEQPKQG